MRARISGMAWIKSLAINPQINEMPPLSEQAIAHIDAIVDDFSETDGESIKAIEGTTNHDVKAIEYFIKEKFAVDQSSTPSPNLFILRVPAKTSITSHTVLCLRMRDDVLAPKMQEIIDFCEKPMTGRHTRCYHTHGQSA